MLDAMYEQLGMQTQTGHELMNIIAQKDAEIEAWRKAQAQINAELLEAQETIAAFRDAQDSLNTQIDDALVDLSEMRRLFGCANAAKRLWRRGAKNAKQELVECRAELEMEKNYRTPLDYVSDWRKAYTLFKKANKAKRGYRKEARALGEYVRRLDFEKGGLIQSLDARD